MSLELDDPSTCTGARSRSVASPTRSNHVKNTSKMTSEHDSMNMRNKSGTRNRNDRTKTDQNADTR